MPRKTPGIFPGKRSPGIFPGSPREPGIFTPIKKAPKKKKAKPKKKS